MPEACFTSRPFEISPVDFTRPVPSRPLPSLPSVPGPTFPPLNQPERSPLYRRNKVNDTSFPKLATEISTVSQLSRRSFKTFFFSRTRKTRQLGRSRGNQRPDSSEFARSAKPRRDEKLTRKREKFFRSRKMSLLDPFSSSSPRKREERAER